ncbi:MAG: toprim domain-containing protein [Pseudomonadota bacterium]
MIYKKSPGMVGRAHYDSILQFDTRNYTIENALLLALGDLYGKDIALSGRSQWPRFVPPGKRDRDGYAAILSPEVALIGRWDTGERHLVVLDDEEATAEERAEARRKAREQAQAAHERLQAELAQQHAQVIERGMPIWHRALRGHQHPYPRRKGVSNGWTRQHRHLLMVPMTDGRVLVNWQFISADGTKRFLTGGSKKGCYHPIGEFDTGMPLLICEGWATGMTLNAATGAPVACAMDAGNLLPVARCMRNRYPGASIIVCCDNDHATEGNPGITKGKKAAAAVGGRAIWPSLDGIEGASDYNDLWQLGRGIAV